MKCKLHIVVFSIISYSYFDKDKNGWLDRDELTRLLLYFGEVYTKRDKQILDDFIACMDKNGDGKIDIEGICFTCLIINAQGPVVQSVVS